MIEVNLDAKPIPVPLNYQPIYKIAILLAILRYGCGSPYRATFLKLHLYMWALRTPINLRVLRQIKEGKRNTIIPWTPEPGLQRTVTLAIIHGLCLKKIVSGDLQIGITEQGEDVLGRIDNARYFEDDFSKIKLLGVVPQNKIVVVNKYWDFK